MSANNWTKCPRCKRLEEERQAKAIQKAEAAYGKVCAAEYQKLLTEADAQSKLEDTLREDYSLGMVDDGEFRVIYRASCGQCGFDYAFKHTSFPGVK